MSIFKTKAIVLKKIKLSEKEFLYTLFSYDYGKIDAIKKTSKKEKSLDLGYDINFEISSNKNNNISKIQNIIIISEFDTTGKNFQTISNYLELLNSILTKTHKGVTIYELYNIIHELNKKNINLEKIVLTKLKAKNIFGELKIENNDKTINSILLFIVNNNIKKILLLTGFNQSLVEKLNKLT